MKKKMRKRGHKRYSICMPVEFYVPVEHTKRKVKIRGVTKDISKKGFSFVSSFIFNKKSAVQFIFRVPDFKSDKDKIFTLKGRILWNNTCKPPVIRQTGICLLKGKNLKIMTQIFNHLMMLYRDRKNVNKMWKKLF